MHWRSIVLLGVVALGLGTAYWYKRRSEAQPEPEIVAPLLPGFDAARLYALRVDHRVRGVQVRLESDEYGRWRIVDPLRDQPADLGCVGGLIEIARDGKGVLHRWEDVPGAAPETSTDARGAALRRLGLDPPRARVEYHERAEGDTATRAERRHVLLLGSLDIDGSGVWVLADDRLMHTSRAFDALLERGLDDYRSRRALEIDPNEVLGIARSGPLGATGPSLSTVGAPFDVALEGVEPGAPAGAAHWRVGAPQRLRMDPLGVSALLRAACVLPVLSFVEEAPADLERYGLATPSLSIELRLRDGTRHVLDFGRFPGAAPAPSDGGDWLCIERGGNTVWRVEPRDVGLLATPLERLLDYRITRAERASITRIEIDCGAPGATVSKLELQKAGERWWLGEPGVAARADDGRVADLLGRLEGTELHEYLPAAVWRDEFRSTRLTLWAEDGGRTAFEFGPGYVHAGTRGLLALRAGDALPVLAPAALEEWLQCARSLWQSREVWKLDELTVAALEVRGPGGSKRFVRDDTSGRWLRDGPRGAAASELEPLLLERLLSVQAQTWLEGADATALSESVEVVWTIKDGRELRLVLGRDATAQVELRCAVGRARPRFPELHAAVLALCRND
jgi:hypothetical protein